MSGRGADRLPADLCEVAAAVAIESSTRYSLRGEPREAPPPAAESGGEPPLVRVLETDLYVRLYGRLRVGPSTASASDPLRLALRDHVNALSAANDGVGTWEAGWRIVSVDEDGRAAVMRDEVTFWVPPEGLRARRLAPGEPCRVRVGKELRSLVPGFYVAIGNGAEADAEPDIEPGPLVRLYWHLVAEGAVPFIAAVTSSLNALGAPFRAKVLADPAAYVRADAGVLYVERRWFGRVRDLVREVHGRLAVALRPEVPMFTRVLAPGLSMAEDPGGGLSFGQARCRTAASALWAAFCDGVENEAGRAAALARAYERQGLDVGALHLAPGSREVYDLEPREAERTAG